MARKKKKTGLGVDAFWETKESEKSDSQEERNLGAQEPDNQGTEEPGNIEMQVPGSTGTEEDGKSDTSDDEPAPINSENEESDELGTEEPRNIERFDKYTFPLSEGLRERMELTVRRVAYEHSVKLPKALMLRMGLEMVLDEIDENFESILSGMAALQEREMEIAAKYTPSKELREYRFPAIKG